MKEKQLHSTFYGFSSGHLPICLMAGMALALSGCSASQIGSERHLKELAKEVSTHVRPAEQRHAEMILTADTAFDDYLRYAILHNPEVETAYHLWLASIAEIAVARSLPDPRITLSLDVMAGITSIMPGIMVDLAGPGRLAAAGEAAAALSTERYQELLAAALTTELDLKKVLWEISYLDRRVKIRRAQLQLLQQEERSARVQVGAAFKSLSDPLKAQTELEKMIAQIENKLDSRTALLERFKGVLGVPPERAPPPLPTLIPDINPNEVEDSADRLLAIAYQYNPKRAAMQAAIETAKRELALANLSNIPDFTVGFETDLKSTPLMLRPMAGLTLPVRRERIAAAISAAEEKLSASEARLSAVEIFLAIETAENHYLAAQATRNILLLQSSLIPKARQNVEIALAAYANGELNLASILAAQNRLLVLQEEEVLAIFQNNIAAVDLLLCCTLVAGFPETLWIKHQNNEEKL